jgi:hypothetical protein
MKVQPVLVEKDYWIMHCLYGLQQLEMAFELKGGTSLSKGYRIINRFSEDIDIRIEPPKGMEVKYGPNHDKAAHRESRKAFYDWLAETITIDGIQKIERDTEFDNDTYRSGGIRLYYPRRPVRSRISRTACCSKPASTRWLQISTRISAPGPMITRHRASS